VALRSGSLSELGATFLGFYGVVLVHRQLRFLFQKNRKHPGGIRHRLKSQEVLDEGIDLSRDR
jgi:hypothetical protein